MADNPPKALVPTLARSSAAEYLTFVAATGGGSASVEMRWMTAARCWDALRARGTRRMCVIRQ